MAPVLRYTTAVMLGSLTSLAAFLGLVYWRTANAYFWPDLIRFARSSRGREVAVIFVLLSACAVLAGHLLRRWPLLSAAPRAGAAGGLLVALFYALWILDRQPQRWFAAPDRVGWGVLLLALPFALGGAVAMWWAQGESRRGR